MIYAFSARGLWGAVIEVEVEVRRGIPGLDIVGMGDNAVREARERIRAACRKSGFILPGKKMTLNLAPAGLRKEGAAFDLAMAVTLLQGLGEPPPAELRLMIMGELSLTGEVRGVRGVLPAALQAEEQKLDGLIVPAENLSETEPFRHGLVLGVHTLAEAWNRVSQLQRGAWRGPGGSPEVPDDHPERRQGEETRGGKPKDGMPHPGHPGNLDYRDLLGQEDLKRALQVAAAGGHNVLLFGPPGCGKTMASRRLQTLLPPLGREASLEVNRLWSLAGQISGKTPLLRHPPFREPHHSASHEGIIGGGKSGIPGEVSLAHRGALFLDEAHYFRPATMQALREPLEQGQVSLVRAGIRSRFPARFQLIMAANPCPCGQMCTERGVCTCSVQEIHHYWRRLGGALLDRIEIRFPVRPAGLETMMGSPGTASRDLYKGVAEARERQERRFRREEFDLNRDIPGSRLREYCPFTKEGLSRFKEQSAFLRLSNRASHAVIRMARTIADIREQEKLDEYALAEAAQYRRYGDGDYFWGP